ncbi:MAG TPA: hypothetical protein VMV05_01840 [bacterium]|nr:hypothetical protein [bacterium]
MKKLLFLLAALLSVGLLGGAKVWADDEPKQDSDFQDNPSAITVSDLEALNNRISSLEKSNVKVGVLLQFWYTHLSYGSVPANGDYGSSKNQWDAFSWKRGEINVGSDIGNDPKISWLVKLDPTQASFNGLGGNQGGIFGYDLASTITGPVTVNGKASPVTTIAANPFSIVKDIYGKVAYSPYATFIFGQNKFAQELEGRWPSGNLDFNNASNLSSAFGSKRDAGVQLAGTGIPVGPLQGEYVLSVIQGAGQSTYDNNVDKDFAGRVGLTYDKNIFVGVSAYDGWEPNGARWDIGFEGRWTYNGFKLQAEFIEGNLNPADNNAANNSLWTPSLPSSFGTPKGQINPTGYYVLASYRYKDLRVGVRLDGYNFNQVTGNVYNNEWDTFTVGLDFFQAKDVFKLSANWEDHLLAGKDVYNLWTVQSQVSL